MRVPLKALLMVLALWQTEMVKALGYRDLSAGISFEAPAGWNATGIQSSFHRP